MRENGTKAERWLPTVADVRQLIRSTQHPLDKAVIALLAKTGMGVGELCNVDVNDICLPDSSALEMDGTRRPQWAEENVPLLRIRVPPEEGRYSTRRERAETTIVPVDEEVYRLVERWLLVRPDAISHAEPLFLSTDANWGERLTPSIVRHIVSERSKSIEFANEYESSTTITPDDLRYFFLERFSGRPCIREYVLGRRRLRKLSIERVHKQYSERIYRLSSSHP